MTDRIPRKWKGWTIEEHIGKGSYGSVYKIRNESGKIAAMKTIELPQNKNDEEALLSTDGSHEQLRRYYESLTREFTKEIDIMEQLKDCPYIVSIDDYCVEPEGDGFCIFIRMEYLNPLPETLTEEEVIRLGIHISSALEFCEEKHILHRDIKAQNILVSDSGIYKLCDFGIARAIEKSCGEMSIKGTFTTMAPEVYRGKPYGRQADIYSLGIVLYTFLNEGRRPFVESKMIAYHDLETALQRRMNGEALPPPSTGSNALIDIVLRAAAYDRHDRFSYAVQMKKALKQLNAGIYRIRRKLNWQLRLRLVMVLTFLMSVSCLSFQLCYDTNYHYFADQWDARFNPDKIRMIDRYKTALGSEYSETDVVGGAQNIEKNMIELARQGDYSSFQKLFIHTDEDTIKYNYDFTQARKEYPYHYWIPLGCTKDLYIVSGINYGLETYGKIYDQDSYLYSIQKNGNQWKSNDSEAAYEQIDSYLIDGGYYPAGYALAARAGRPHFMYHDSDYAYLSSSFLYEGEVYPYQMKFAWQNRDGSMGLLFVFKNNLDMDRYVKGIHLTLCDKEFLKENLVNQRELKKHLDDPNQMLLDEYIDIDRTIPAGQQTLVYKEVDSYNKEIGSWDDIDEVIFEMTESGEEL